MPPVPKACREFAEMHLGGLYTEGDWLDDLTIGGQVRTAELLGDYRRRVDGGTQVSASYVSRLVASTFGNRARKTKVGAKRLAGFDGISLPKKEKGGKIISREEDLPRWVLRTKREEREERELIIFIYYAHA